MQRHWLKYNYYRVHEVESLSLAKSAVDGRAGVGKLLPPDLRRTAITRALDLGESIREVQMMSEHRDVRSLMKYDHGKDNIEKNPVNRLHYDD